MREEWGLATYSPGQSIDVPPSVEGLVMATLDSLDQTARIVLQHASVIVLISATIYWLQLHPCTIWMLPWPIWNNGG